MPAFFNIKYMKYFVIILLLIMFGSAHAQTVGQFRYDTTKFLKVGGYNEVKIQNATKDSVGGLFVNTGAGWGKWLRPRAVSGGISFGVDTVLMGGGTAIPANEVAVGTGAGLTSSADFTDDGSAITLLNRTLEIHSPSTVIVDATTTLELLSSGTINLSAPILNINNAYTIPVVDGNPNDVLTTDGAGAASWQPGAATDTTSLSNRINLRLLITDTANMRARLLGSNILISGSYPNLTLTVDTTSGATKIATQGFVTRSYVNKTDSAGATGYSQLWKLYKVTDSLVKSTSAQNLGTLTWTAGTDPSGSINKTYTWTKKDKEVTISYNITASVAGATVTTVVFPLPSDVPLPLEPAGLGAASDRLYGGVGFIAASLTSDATAIGRTFLAVNAADNGYVLRCVGPTSSAILVFGTVTYTSQ